MTHWPFNPNVPKNTWTDIEAAGFPTPVPGCLYNGSRLDGGIPLGGLGTGYFTLEGTGKIGFCSIFNDIVPPRSEFKDWLSVRANNITMPLSSAEITYWGHYPMADLVAEFSEVSLTLGLRAFSPFVPGSAPDSNIPAALFEIEITNHAAEPQTIELTTTFPSPIPGKGYQTHTAGEDFTVDGKNATAMLTIMPGASQRVRLVFTWYAPTWRDSGGEAHVNRYAQRYTGAHEAADDVLGRFDSLAGRILSWQRVVYDEHHLPAWLRDGLIQGLYSLAKNTIWIAKTRKDEWWGDDGWFSHNESHTGCPITETMVCRMHGHFPILFFFPELEQSTLEAFRHFQISDGEIPFSYGVNTSMRDPRYHCQHPLNSSQYVQMIYRLYQRTGDASQLAHFYDSARRALRYLYTLDDDNDGLVNDQPHTSVGELWPANQFYDIWPWWGTSAYVAGTWLGTLTCGAALAEAVGDSEFAQECRTWLARGQAAYDAKLWTGEYYRLWNDEDGTSLVVSERKSDVSLGNQLMAQWCVRIAGIPDVLPAEKIQSALHTVKRLNMAATAYGLVNGVTPDGQRYDSKVGSKEEAMIAANNDHAKQVFFGENFCAAMTFIYHGQTDTGIEIAKRIYESVALKAVSPWNQRCINDAESGLPVWGDDYYSNMVIWAMPMALAGQNVANFSDEGQLVTRIIAAGHQVL